MKPITRYNSGTTNDVEIELARTSALSLLSLLLVEYEPNTPTNNRNPTAVGIDNTGRLNSGTANHSHIWLMIAPCQIAAGIIRTKSNRAT